MNTQIAVTGKSKDDYMMLVALLKERGYKLSEDLKSLKNYDQIIAVMIDND